VKGFLNQPREGQGHTHLQAWTREGRTSRGAFFKEPIAKLERRLQSVQVPLYYLPCCIYCLKNSIYIHLSQTSFPRGVLSRVMLTKNP
jgi:hypothetical protein